MHVLRLHKQSILLDSLLVLVVIYLPSLSHLLPLPIYYIDPMRMVLLTGIIFSSNHRNTYLLALALPLVSYLTSGHPIFPKNILIVFELLINVYLFYFLYNRYTKPAFCLLISILGSKLVYYGIKFFFIKLGILHTQWIDTHLYIQVVVFIVFTVFFTLLWKFRKSH